MILGSNFVPSMVAVGVAHAASGQAYNPEDYPDDQPDEGAGNERKRIEKSFSQCSRYGRRFSVSYCIHYVGLSTKFYKMDRERHIFLDSIGRVDTRIADFDLQSRGFIFLKAVNDM